MRVIIFWFEWEFLYLIKQVTIMSDVSSSGKEVKVHDKYFVPYISAEKIGARIKELAQKIVAECGDKEPLFIVILNGAFMFASDLIKEVPIDCQVTFTKLSSYVGQHSTGDVKEVAAIDIDVKGRTVIIVEDIVDTGNTMHHYLKDLKARGVGDIKIASLLSKPEALQYDIHIDYLGFEIDNKFVIGYGLDYDYKGRNFPDIYQLKS